MRMQSLPRTRTSRRRARLDTADAVKIARDTSIDTAFREQPDVLRGFRVQRSAHGVWFCQSSFSPGLPASEWRC